MALIECPECKKRISDLADACPNCGLPKGYFGSEKLNEDESVLLENFPNILQSFSYEYNSFLNQKGYIAYSE